MEDTGHSSLRNKALDLITNLRLEVQIHKESKNNTKRLN